jgi:hypothetical protein
VTRDGDAGYLPLTALARYSGLSVRTLRTHLARRSHPLPCFRIGGKILVKRADFDMWAEQFRSTAADCVDAIVAETLRGL